jgi:hypothetical protein
MKSLAICAVIKNEAPYIAEWIEFHRLVGVSRFVLYDDESTDGTREVVMSRDRGDITLYPFSDTWYHPRYDGVPMHLGWHVAHQARAFGHFDACHAGESFWCAFIDPDEFLWHLSEDSLPRFLEPFESHPCVVANWLVFGSNGHQTKPPGLTIENYTRRGEAGRPEPWGRHVKPIVQMGRSHRWGPCGSHCPVFDDGRPAVDQHGKPNPWSMRPQAESIGLRVHHYYHRSSEEAAAKLLRGYHGIPPGYPGKKRLDAHDRNEVEDAAILRFLPSLKIAMLQKEAQA